jgi:hypothetical protein
MELGAVKLNELFVEVLIQKRISKIKTKHTFRNIKKNITSVYGVRILYANTN